MYNNSASFLFYLTLQLQTEKLRAEQQQYTQESEETTARLTAHVEELERVNMRLKDRLRRASLSESAASLEIGSPNRSSVHSNSLHAVVDDTIERELRADNVSVSMCMC